MIASITQFLRLVSRQGNAYAGVYAGVGSRSAPAESLALMRRIARRLSSDGWLLRSGAAPGSDSAFELGAARAMAEIFLPWDGFRGRRGHTPTPEAFAIAEAAHPLWGKLSPSARKLLARNAHQVLGADLRSPCAFLLCWTPDGAKTAAETMRETGGTGQAIRIADSRGIPIFNLGRAGDALLWREYAYATAPATANRLKIWTNDADICVADSAPDARRIALEAAGESHEDDRLSPLRYWHEDSREAISIVDWETGEVTTRTASEWIAINGPGLLCSVER